MVTFFYDFLLLREKQDKFDTMNQLHSKKMNEGALGKYYCVLFDTWDFILEICFATVLPELEKVLNVPIILKLVMEMFLKNAVIFKSRTDF